MTKSVNENKGCLIFQPGQVAILIITYIYINRVNILGKQTFFSSEREDRETVFTIMIKTSASLTLKSFQLSLNLALVIPSVFFLNASLFLLCLPHIVITYIVLIHKLDINDPKGASRSSPSRTLVHAEHKSFLPFPPSLGLSGKNNNNNN